MQEVHAVERQVGCGVGRQDESGSWERSCAQHVCFDWDMSVCNVSSMSWCGCCVWFQQHTFVVAAMLLLFCPDTSACEQTLRKTLTLLLLLLCCVQDVRDVVRSYDGEEDVAAAFKQRMAQLAGHKKQKGGWIRGG